MCQGVVSERPAFREDPCRTGNERTVPRGSFQQARTLGGPPTDRIFLTNLIRPVNKRLEAPLRRQHVNVPVDDGCRTELALPQQLQRQPDVPLLAIYETSNTGNEDRCRVRPRVQAVAAAAAAAVTVAAAGYISSGANSKAGGVSRSTQGQKRDEQTL